MVVEHSDVTLLARGEGLSPQFQPIHDLVTGDLVGYEALARGPAGSPLELPSALFAAADEQGLTSELDLACQLAALADAHVLGMRSPLTLFLNMEPSTLQQLTIEQARKLDEASAGLRVIVEVTERDLVGGPAELLGALEAARSRGWGIAIDDVGSQQASLALIPLIRPDVIKLDMSVVQGGSSSELAAIAGAVSAEAERTGATVIAEGIETAEHHDRALGLGADLGQGWLLGRPSRAIGQATSSRLVGIRAGLVEPRRRTPFELVSALRPVRRARKPLLRAVSRDLESQTVAQNAPSLLLGTFEGAQFFTPPIARRYARFARELALVAAFGTGLAEEPAPGVRGGHIEAHDLLAREWAVIVLGPRFAGMLAAWDLGDDGPDDQRRFDFCTTYNRDLVAEAAHTILARIAPPSRLHSQLG